MRRQRNVAAGQKVKVDAWERMLDRPEGMAAWMDEVVGIPIGQLLHEDPVLVEDVRTQMLAGIAAARQAPPPKPVEHWAVSERFRGLEGAGLVVVNLRDESERVRAAQLVDDVYRLRKDDALFKGILSWRGYRIPITAVVANLADPRDPGRKKALARVHRAIRSPSR